MKTCAGRILTTLLCLGIAAGCAEGRSDADDDSTHKPPSGTGGAGGTMTVAGGPEVTALLANPPTMTEGASVTFAATVTDTDGLDDIVGGMLKSADGTVYGPFVQLSGGTFSISLSWSEVNALEPINFFVKQGKTFVAEFSDATQKVGSRRIELMLECDTSSCGAVAVDGECDEASCACLCGLLYDCGLGTSGGDQRCPGFTGAPSESASFYETCRVHCEAMSTLSWSSDCDLNVSDYKQYPWFDELCKNGAAR